MVKDTILKSLIDSRLYVELSPTKQILILFSLSKMDESGIVRGFSSKEISEITKINEQSVTVQISELEKLNYLKKLPVKGGEKRMYDISPFINAMDEENFINALSEENSKIIEIKSEVEVSCCKCCKMKCAWYKKEVADFRQLLQVIFLFGLLFFKFFQT